MRWISATAARAGLALAAVDQELVLHRSTLPARVPVVVDRGASAFQPGLQRPDHALAQRLGVLAAHRARRRERMKLRPPERLVGVDVSDPGDPRLVEQERLQRRPPPRRQRLDHLRRELVRERLDSDPALEAGLEAAVGIRNASPKRRASLKRSSRPSPRSKLARRKRSGRRWHRRPSTAATRPPLVDQQQVAGHPQVHDQGRRRPRDRAADTCRAVSAPRSSDR